ncbi:MAG: hypothetical protein PHC94_00830 [Methylobacter sp.]|nr:hypothetical protein [Methylococcales bacterium]MDD5112532.1 hypothetical protein [Methylobacter sp.]
MYRYSIYGLTVSSELECPLLLSAKEQVDITIRFGAIPSCCISADTHKGANFIGNGKLLLDIQEIAKYLISDGNAVLIEPYPNAKEEMIRLFLLGSALGILLHQRDILPLHGCGIVYNDKAILFLGETGIGKSTLAETFRRKGYKLLTDDVSALCFSNDASVKVFPAYPKINLMEETAKNFNIPIEGLPEAHPQKRKYSIPVGESFCPDPKPLSRIYILHQTDQKSIRLEVPQKIAAIPFLTHNTYRKQVIEKMGLLQRHIDQCAHLADNYPVRLLSRPDDLSRLPELADCLESDFL